MGLEQTIADGQLLVALAVALAAGVVSFLSPCVLPLIPGYLAYVSGIAGSSGSGSGRSNSRDGAEGSTSSNEGRENNRPSSTLTRARQAQKSERRRMVIGSLLFVTGFTVVFVAMLSLAGTVGIWLLEWENLITRVMGVVIIVMGLVFIGLLGRMQRTTRLNLKPRLGLAGAPLLGAVFAIGWTPCIGPTLSVVMSLSLQTGSTGRAAVLGIAYSLGLGLPFVIAAFGFGWMTQTMTFFKKHMRAVNLIGGGLLILIGLLMVSGVWTEIMYSLQAVMGDFGTIL